MAAQRDLFTVFRGGSESVEGPAPSALKLRLRRTAPGPETLSRDESTTAAGAPTRLVLRLKRRAAPPRDEEAPHAAAQISRPPQATPSPPVPAAPAQGALGPPIRDPLSPWVRLGVASRAAVLGVLDFGYTLTSGGRSGEQGRAEAAREPTEARQDWGCDLCGFRTHSQRGLSLHQKAHGKRVHEVKRARAAAAVSSSSSSEPAARPGEDGDGEEASRLFFVAEELRYRVCPSPWRRGASERLETEA